MVVPFIQPPDVTGRAPIHQITEARSIFEGAREASGHDLSALSQNAFTPAGRDFLAKNYPDIWDRILSGDPEQGVSVADLAALGLDQDRNKTDLILDPNIHLRDNVRESLRNIGLVHGDFLADPGVARKTMEGEFPEITSTRQGLFDLGQQRLEALGFNAETGEVGPGELDFLRQQAIRDIQFNPFGEDALDPVTKATLQDVQQSIRGAFSARGLGESGASAFLESGAGIQALESLRQQRQSFGIGALKSVGDIEGQRLGQAFGLLEGAQQLGFGDLQNQALGLSQLQFNQNLFGDLLLYDANQKFVAANQAGRLARQATDPNIIESIERDPAGFASVFTK